MHATNNWISMHICKAHIFHTTSFEIITETFLKVKLILIRRLCAKIITGVNIVNSIIILIIVAEIVSNVISSARKKTQEGAESERLSLESEEVEY